ncbi:MAG: RNA-binding protein [Deferrisomatales bacterium]
MSIRLFVGNLAYDVTETQLRELFSQAGPVAQVRLPTDRETGKPRGFGFVDFADRAAGEEAIRRFDQHVFRDRALAVNEARARDAQPPPRPRVAPRPSWPGLGDAPPEEDRGASIRPKRTFGPDAAGRGKRRPEGYGSRKERKPRGPLREQGGGQLHAGADVDDEDDAVLDNFALWAREDAKTNDEE